jgi:integral membrane sensor domain MASE1
MRRREPDNKARERFVQQSIVSIVVAVAYYALGEVSRLVAYSPGDAWTVWLASGITFGALLAAQRERWLPILAGGFIGAGVFALRLGVGFLDALGYGVIEVVTAGGAALLVSRLAVVPLRLASARDLAAMIGAGALPLALLGAILATAWHVATGGQAAAQTFRLWVISNFIGTLLVAPVIVSWSMFRVRRSGGMTMPAFAAGAVACALFLGTMQILFDTNVDATFGGIGESLTYLPIVFMAFVALLWGTRGATLAAFIGAMIAIVNTTQHEGPFAGSSGLLGEPELEVQGFALAIAITGLLIAVLDARQRNAVREARDWRARFTAAIAAHRLIAYEWDPASGRFVVTGDTAQLLGVAPDNLATLADWLALVPGEDRERIATRFDERVRGHGEADTVTYVVAAGAGSTMTASDEARAIRDHDGELHRVVGMVRLTPMAALELAA